MFGVILPLLSALVSTGAVTQHVAGAAARRSAASWCTAGRPGRLVSRCSVGGCLARLLCLIAIASMAVPARGQGPVQPPGAAAAGCPADHSTGYNFFDIAATGARLLDTATGAASAEIALPFGFPWYGQSEASITVGVDGLITFGSTPQPSSGISEPLPCAGVCPGTDYSGATAERGVDMSPTESTGPTDTGPPDVCDDCIGCLWNGACRSLEVFINVNEVDCNGNGGVWCEATGRRLQNVSCQNLTKIVGQLQQN
jgi:hypothetical protein